MMGRADPFTGYSVVLRTIVYVVVPLFTVLQFIRLRRGLHVFQLEGYKRARFLEWVSAHRERAWWLRRFPQKKPLVMTGRAWRILLTATVLSALINLAVPGLAHVGWGAPADLVTWSLVTAVLFAGASHLLIAADILLSPVQGCINGRYLRSARRKLSEISPLVIGVTGSFGKTSTKFAIQGLVGESDEVLATPGSFNTPLGVCRTINEHLAPSHRFFVVEMGAYREGDIAELARFVRPSIGVLTAIGPAHLERFGSLDAIRRAKYEIVQGLPDDGTAVMNIDDPEVRRLADTTSGPTVVRYGLDGSGRPDITARDVAVTPEGTSLTVCDERSGETLRAQTRLLGRHAVGHVLAGVAVATAAGRRLADLGRAIGGLEPVEHRLQLIRGTGGITVIDDAYNANPDGAAAALEVLASMPGNTKVVVTPGIVELGAVQEQENETFGEKAARAADVIIVVARVNRDAIATGVRRGNAQVIAVDSLDEATERLRDILKPGDVVLFENDLPDQYE